MAKNRRRAKKESYLSKRRQKNKRFFRTAVGLVVVAGLGFFYLNSSMNKENENMTKDIISSQKKLEDVKTEIKSLKEDYEMRNTDEFKEKVAKEKLGMVKKSKDDEEENSVIKPVTNSDQQAKPTDNSNNQAPPANNQANSNGNANQKSDPNQNNNPNGNTNQNLNQNKVPNANTNTGNDQNPSQQVETQRNENGR